MKVIVRDPVQLWAEIRKVISAYHQVGELKELKDPWALRSFMRDYPELYHIYLTLGLESSEVKAQRKEHGFRASLGLAER